MKVSLGYGKGKVDVMFPEKNFLGFLEAPPNTVNNDSQQLVIQALNKPEGTKRLAEIAREKQAGNAVIIVNDITRPTPYHLILPPILSELEGAGVDAGEITLVVALGIHRPHTEEENRRIFGEYICTHYQIENHNCDENLISLGTLSNGMELIINRKVAEADILITTGVVGLHYFAGYSGGRKSILPGVAARSLIEANHKLMNDTRACLGNYKNNPVSDIMIEAARLVDVDFAFNVVLAGKNEIAFAAAGDIYESWLKAVQVSESMNVVSIEEKADIVLASCGGYPKDINMYQAQKGLDAAAMAVREGGSILLVAECAEGLGEETFAKWIENATCPDDIVKRFNEAFELGGHKAYAICRTLENAMVYLYSSLPVDTVEHMFMKPVADLDREMKNLLHQYGDNTGIWVMPEAPRIAVKIPD